MRTTVFFRQFIFLFATFSTSQLYAQLPSVAWANVNINGGADDEAIAVATDPSGNTYSTGYFTGTADFDPGPSSTMLSVGPTITALHQVFISKYSPSGNLDWAFGLGGTLDDEGSDIVADDSGYVYVTGFFSGTAPVDFDPSTGIYNLSCSGGKDIFIAKYNSNLLPGDPSFFQWAFKIGGTGQDKGNAITVDDSGMVYLTGYFNSSNIDFDPSVGSTLLTGGTNGIFLAKYNGHSNPSQLSFIRWAFKITGGSGNDGGFSVIADDSGYVLVGGTVNTTNVDFDPSPGTHIFNPAGANVGFLAKYNGRQTPSSLSFYEWAFTLYSTYAANIFSMDFDSLGMLYVTGQYGGTVDFDPSNNINTHTGGSGYNFVAKYNPTIQPTSTSFYQWSFSLGINNNYDLTSIACTPGGDFYVTGTFGQYADLDPSVNFSQDPGTGLNIFVAKYNGNLLPSSTSFFKWLYTCAAANTRNFADDIALDQQERIHLAGKFNANLLDFDQSPGITTISNSDRRTGNSSTKTNDLFIASFDGNYNPDSAAFFRWVNQAGNYDAKFYPQSIKTDAAGNIFATGEYLGEVDLDPGPLETKLIGRGYYVSKSDAAGNLIWGFGADSIITPTIAINSSGHLFICAKLIGFNADFDPSSNTTIVSNPGSDSITVVAAYDVNYIPSDPQFYKWSFTLEGSDGRDVQAPIIVDNSDNVYLSGYFTSAVIDLDPSANTSNLTNAGSKDAYIAQYDGSLQPSSASFFKWVAPIAGPGAERISQIVLYNNSLYIAGTISANVDMNPSWATNNLNASTDDAFVAKYDVTLPPSSTSFYKWAFRAGGTNGDEGVLISVDTAGIVYLAGIFKSSNVDFDPSAGTNTLTSGSSSFADMFVAKYDGNQLPTSISFFKWAFRVSEISAAIRQLVSMEVDVHGNIYITGGVNRTVADFDPSAGLLDLGCSSIRSHIYLVKYDGNFLPSNPSFTKWGFKMGSTYTGRNNVGCMTLDNSGGIILGADIDDPGIELDPSSSSDTVSYCGVMLRYNEPCTAANITSPATSMCFDDANVILTGTPSGGTYSGPGVGGNSFDPSVAGNGGHTVIYSYTFANGCTDSSSTIITVDACTGINSFSGEGGVLIYPNPTVGEVQIVLRDSSTLTIFSTLGEIVMSVQMPQGNHKLNLQELAEGVYFVQTKSTQGTSVQPLVIHR